MGMDREGVPQLSNDQSQDNTQDQASDITWKHFPRVAAFYLKALLRALKLLSIISKHKCEMLSLY